MKDMHLPKGTRDFPPEEKLLRDNIVAKIQQVFHLYGFNPLETPIFERKEVLTSKYAGGAEILKEMFIFQDQGQRDLALRYDLTVPFARFVAMNPQIKMPFRRYSIGKVFRDGPIKLGRYREFYQCDADIVGAKTMGADAECILMALAGFHALDIPVRIEINNRKLLEDLMQAGKVPKEKLLDAMLVLDKLAKVGLEQVQKELQEKGIPPESLKEIISITEKKSNEEKIAAVEALVGNTKGLQEIKEVVSLVDNPSVVFTPTLSRGLAYYTGTVFEGFTTEGELTASLCGGGRYDNLIGNLVGNGEYPTVGFSFGLEPIMDVLKSRVQSLKQSTATVFIIPIKTQQACMAIAAKLRAAGIATDIDINNKSISKNLEYANSYGIPFTVIAGKKELDEGKVKLKDMVKGTEELVSVDDAIKNLVNKD